jgi:alkaline phosphatase
MKKLLSILFVVLMLSGCSDGNPDLQQIETENSPTITATLDEISRVEVTPTIQVTNTIAPTITPRDRPRIILFIGDGMGSGHRTAGQYYAVGEARELTMNALPVSGWLHPDLLDGELPESAAAATALATGQKTISGVISLDSNGNQLKTILEYAQELGMSTGLVSNKYITDATTAAFGAHVESNAMGPEVASQFLEHRVDVIFGGGENDFLPRGVAGCHPEMGKRIDERNLFQEAEDAGYIVICDEQSFDALDPQTDSLVIGLFADENMARPYSPSLADMTRTAIEILSLNPNGFFLVVEGAMIDIASHYHQTQNVFDDVVGLDEAVKVGMEYAELDEDMLIIVTADHETGGLVVNFSPSGYSSEEGPFHMPNGTEFYISWSSGDHTRVDVPVTAFGPVSEKLAGINDNTIVFDVMLEFLGISNPLD